jgi:hypothetical protein
LDEPEQIVVVPEIAPGVVGVVFTVITLDEEPEVPHAFEAVTLMLPLVPLAVVVMELVVDVPVQPPGLVQV